MHAQILDLRLSVKGIKPVRNGHPWVFRNALHGPATRADLESALVRTLHGPDALVWEHTHPAVVRDPSGAALGWGIYNPVSRLALRMFSLGCDTLPVRSQLEHRIAAALYARVPLLTSGDHTAFRLVFGEADAIPGLVADRYGDLVVAQYSGAFAWDNRVTIAAALVNALGEYGVDARVVESIDAATLKKDGIDTGVNANGTDDATAGNSALASAQGADENAGGADEVSTATIIENGLPWIINPAGGQKTGHYCDQRENRAALARVAAALGGEGARGGKGALVLDAFAYHGGFALTALATGATGAVCLDSSAAALERLRENAALQGVAERVETIRGDAFELLRSGHVGDHGLAEFDLIVLDPPKLVTQRRDLESGLRAYKDLNLSVFRAARRGTRVATFSCSGAVSRDDFRRALAWAAKDAGRPVAIEAEFGQPADHPIPLHFPEAEYLTGFLLRVG